VSKFILPAQKGDELFPTTVVAPPIIRWSGSVDPQSEDGQRILDRCWSAIMGFYSQQNHNHSLSQNQQSRAAQQVAPDVFVTYVNQSGIEYLTIQIGAQPSKPKKDDEPAPKPPAAPTFEPTPEQKYSAKCWLPAPADGKLFSEQFGLMSKGVVSYTPWGESFYTSWFESLGFSFKVYGRTVDTISPILSSGVIVGFEAQKPGQPANPVHPHEAWDYVFEEYQQYTVVPVERYPHMEVYRSYIVDNYRTWRADIPLWSAPYLVNFGSNEFPNFQTTKSRVYSICLFAYLMYVGGIRLAEEGISLAGTDYPNSAADWPNGRNHRSVYFAPYYAGLGLALQPIVKYWYYNYIGETDNVSVYRIKGKTEFGGESRKRSFCLFGWHSLIGSYLDYSTAKEIFTPEWPGGAFVGATFGFKRCVFEMIFIEGGKGSDGSDCPALIGYSYKQMGGYDTFHPGMAAPELSKYDPVSLAYPLMEIYYGAPSYQLYTPPFYTDPIAAPYVGMFVDDIDGEYGPIRCRSAWKLSGSQQYDRSSYLTNKQFWWAVMPDGSLKMLGPSDPNWIPPSF
jgi:hypothetical protein